MNPRFILTLGCSVLFATTMTATTFIVPTDDELLAKSSDVVIGTIEGAYVDERENDIETVYELRVERAMKGRTLELIRVVSPGGVIGDRGVLVPASAHFHQGDRVLLFLTRDEDGRWRTTDLTLGKFRFVTSTAGERLLVRDMEDVVGWDHRGQVHHEKVRREAGFLRFLEERIRGGAPKVDYEVDASEVTLPAEDEGSAWRIQANAAPFPGSTYTSWVNNQPIRWPNISAGVTFYKRTDQNISGAADGGVSVIQNGLAAWTNECGSVVNLIYGGQRATASVNHDGFNVVEFNDPQSRISGSWTGSGTIGLAFTSFAGTHSFAGSTYLNITGADVVFQNGFPATHGAFGAAMTHELGHGIGWRHSNQHYNGGGACNSSVEQCTSAAIMNSSVSGSYGYTLQPWDVNAVQSVYPGGTCGPTCTPPSITNQPDSSSITAGETKILQVAASGTTPLSYQWYVGASGNTANPISGATSSSITVGPSTTTSYWVRVSNSCGGANSTTATITVTSLPPAPQVVRSRTDFDGDGRADLFWRHLEDGRNAVWFMNGATTSAAVQFATIPLSWTPAAFGDFDDDGTSDVFWRNSNGANVVWLFQTRNAVSALNATSMATQWAVEVAGDFNGDGRADILWRNPSTGANSIWYMNGSARTAVTMANVSVGYRAVASGDFDGNGRYDVFWRNDTTGANLIWLMGSAGPEQISVGVVPAPWKVAGSGDFNEDGRSDLLWRNQSSGSNSIWLMNRTPYQGNSVATVPSGWTVGVIGHFNGDGVHDIAWRGANGYNFIMFMNGGQIASQSAMTALNEQAWQMFGLR
jgi:hypothetical protein